VRFRYRRPGARQVTQRRVHPYGLGYREGEWYLVGEDQGRGDVRQFKVARIVGAVQVAKRGPAFTIPPGFQIEHHLERAPWEFAGGAEESAEVLFGPEVAWMVEQGRRAGERFEKRADGSGVLHLKVRRSPKTHQQLLSYLAQYSGDCAILGPAWLRKQATAHLRELRKRYA
ncbi:MAG: helix-turn-helix transcriptional regulator, partial [Planctomycetota bacterium]